MPSVRRRRLLAVLGVPLLVLLAVATWMRVGYPGMTEMMLLDLRHGGWAETVERYRFLYYYADTLDRLRPVADEANARVEIPPPQADQDPFERGVIDFHRGEFVASVAQFREHLADEGESERGLFWLSQALMRQAEVENCLEPLRAEGEGTGPFGPLTAQRVCSLPLPSPHHRPAAMDEAAEILTTLLDDHAPDDPLYLWLLNFAHMAQGTFPDGVPARHLVDTQFTRMFYGEGRDEARQRFPWLHVEDRAAELGVDLLDVGKGVAVEDFDGDGDLDLVTGGTFGHLHLFLNRHSEGGRGFDDASVVSGLSRVIQPFAVSAADFDGDGAMDLFVSRPFHHFQLLRNDGRGVFEDVTFSSGLLQPEELEHLSFASFLSAWGDVNGDGRLDLVVPQFAVELPGTIAIYDRPYAASRLYVNEGTVEDGPRFVDRTAEYGLVEIVADRLMLGAAFGDYDGDGWLDLFLTAYPRGRSRLLRNRQGKAFDDSGLVNHPETGFSTAFFDLEHDGLLDLFQGGQGPAPITTADVVLRVRPERDASRFFLQTASGFAMSKEVFSPPIPAGTMGVGFGDLDNDGCLDAYLGTGNPESWYVVPNLLYIGERDGPTCTGRMLHASALEGFGTIQKGHGIVFFDFDEDGDQDVYSSLGGMWQGDAWPNQLWVNESDTGHAWTKIRLRGRQSNRWGLGSTITVEARNADGERILRRHLMDNGTSFGSAPYLAHVGLLDAVAIDRITVTWMGSGCVGEYEAELGQLQWLDEADCLQTG